jgi:hypothetical protein
MKVRAKVKVRVKATGEIKEVARGIYSPYKYVDKEGTIYTENDIEFSTSATVYNISYPAARRVLKNHIRELKKKVKDLSAQLTKK